MIALSGNAGTDGALMIDGGLAANAEALHDRDNGATGLSLVMAGAAARATDGLMEAAV